MDELPRAGWRAGTGVATPAWHAAGPVRRTRRGCGSGSSCSPAELPSPSSRRHRLVPNGRTRHSAALDAPRVLWCITGQGAGIEPQCRFRMGPAAITLAASILAGAETQRMAPGIRAIETHQNGADVYRFVRRFPADQPDNRTAQNTVQYADDRVVVFQDERQVVVIQPPRMLERAGPPAGADPAQRGAAQP